MVQVWVSFSVFDLSRHLFTLIKVSKFILVHRLPTMNAAMVMISSMLLSVFGPTVLLCSRNSHNISAQLNYYVFTSDTSLNKAVRVCDANFTDKRRTRIFVHGFQDTPCTGKPVVEATFKLEPNFGRVILLDWSKLADWKKGAFEGVASEQIPAVAKHLSMVLKYITAKGGERIELVGHSFGAHVVGQAARIYYKETGRKIGKVVGLDPGYFEFRGNKNALRCSDAENVLVIHTDMHGLGFGSKICSDDILANGGIFQPECLTKVPGCSHLYAIQRYVDFLSGRLSRSKQDYFSLMDVPFKAYFLVMNYAFNQLLPCDIKAPSRNLTCGINA